MKIRKATVAAAIVTILLTLGSLSASAQKLTDVLKSGSTISNLIEGVFASSKLSLADLAGEWTTTGPAVCFQSENFLQKAGGIAAAAAVESKINPYYEKYGLNGAVISITKEGTFTMKVKRISLRGSITESDPANGVFEFNFSAAGIIKLGAVKCYVQKTSNSLDLMFDATKLKTILGAVATLSGSTLAKSAVTLLDSYDGMCAGFKCSLTGDAPASPSTNSVATPGEPENAATSNKAPMQSLKDLLNKAKQTTESK